MTPTKGDGLTACNSQPVSTLNTANFTIISVHLRHAVVRVISWLAVILRGLS